MLSRALVKLMIDVLIWLSEHIVIAGKGISATDLDLESKVINMGLPKNLLKRSTIS